MKKIITPLAALLVTFFFSNNLFAQLASETPAITVSQFNKLKQRSAGDSVKNILSSGEPASAKQEGIASAAADADTEVIKQPVRRNKKIKTPKLPAASN